MSATLPVYNYMKKHGYPVDGGSITIESTFGGRKNGIYIPHGVSRENTDSTRKIAAGSFGVLVPGPIGYEACETSPYTDRMGGVYSDTPGLEKIKMVGWPKSDLLFSPERDKAKREVEDLLKLPYEKTILLAVCQDVDELTKITARLKMNLVIKPHIGAQQQKRYTVTKAPHIRWMDPSTWDDITRLFLISDLCIVNMSGSVATEFMVTEKPVLSNGRGWAGRLRVSGFDFSKEDYPSLLGGWKKFEENIKRCIDNPDELKTQREKWLNRMIYKPDGHASERAAKAIMELVGKK